MKRIGLLSTTVVVVAVGAMAVGQTGASSGEGGGRTLTYTARSSDNESFVDNPPEGPSLGDTFVFGDILEKDGRDVGRANGTCTVTSLEPPDNHCLGTFTLPEGTIHFVAGDDGPPDLPLVIVGGTGRFSGARGTALVRLVDDEAGRSEITIRILP